MKKLTANKIAERNRKMIGRLMALLGPGAHIVGNKVLYIRMVPEWIPENIRADFFHKIQEIIDADLQRFFDLYGAMQRGAHGRGITQKVDLPPG